MDDTDSTISFTSSDINVLDSKPERLEYPPRHPPPVGATAAPARISSKEKPPDPTRTPFRPPAFTSAFSGSANNAFRVNNSGGSGGGGLLGKFNQIPSTNNHPMKLPVSGERRDPAPQTEYSYPQPRPKATAGADPLSDGSDADVLNDLEDINRRQASVAESVQTPTPTPQRSPEKQLPPQETRQHDGRAARRSATEAAHQHAQNKPAASWNREGPTHEAASGRNDSRHNAAHRSLSSMEPPREKRRRPSTAQVANNDDVPSTPVSSQPPSNQEQHTQRRQEYEHMIRREAKDAARTRVEAATTFPVQRPIEEVQTKNRRGASIAVSEKGQPTDPICLDDDDEDDILYDHEETGAHENALRLQASNRSAKAKEDANAMPPPPPPLARARRPPPESLTNGANPRQQDGRPPSRDGNPCWSRNEAPQQQPPPSSQPPQQQQQQQHQQQQSVPTTQRKSSASNRSQPTTPLKARQTLDLTAEPKEVHYYPGQTLDRRRQRAESEAAFKSIYENATQQGSQYGHGSSTQVQVMNLLSTIEVENRGLHDSIAAAEKEIGYQKELAARARQDNIRLETEMNKYKNVLGTALTHFNRVKNFVEGLGRDVTALKTKQICLQEGVKDVSLTAGDVRGEMANLRHVVGEYTQTMLDRGDPLNRLNYQVTQTLDGERALESARKDLLDKAGLLAEERTRTQELEIKLAKSQEYARELLGAVQQLQKTQLAVKQDGTETLEIARSLKEISFGLPQALEESLVHIDQKTTENGVKLENIEGGFRSWLKEEKDQDFALFTARHDKILEVLNEMRDAFSEKSGALVDLSTGLMTEIQKLASSDTLDSMSASIEDSRESIVAVIKKKTEEFVWALEAGNQKSSDAITALLEREKVAQTKLVQELDGAKMLLDTALVEKDGLEKLVSELRREIDILHKAPLTEKEAYRALEERTSALEDELRKAQQSKDLALKEADSLKIELKHERDKYEEARVRITNFEKERSEHAGKIEMNLKDERIQMETIARKLREAEQIKSENRIRILDAEIQDLKAKLVTKQGEVDALGMLKSENEDVKRKFSETLEMATNHAKEANRLRDQLKKLESLENDRDSLRHEIVSAHEKIAALKDEANASAQKYEEELQVLVADKNALNDQIQQLKKEISDKRKLVESEKINNARVTTLHNSLEKQLAEVKAERDKLQCSIVTEATNQLELERSRYSFEQLCKMHEQKIAQLENDLAGLKNDLNITKGSESQISTEKRAIATELAASKDRLRDLEERDNHLRSVYEKWEKARRQLLEARSQKQRQKGSALVTSLQEKLRTAMDDFNTVAMRLWFDQEFVPDVIDLSLPPSVQTDAVTSPLSDPTTSVLASDPAAAQPTSPTPTRSSKIRLAPATSKTAPVTPAGPVTRTQTRHHNARPNHQSHNLNKVFGGGEVPSTPYPSGSFRTPNVGNGSRILVRKGTQRAPPSTPNPNPRQQAPVARVAPIAPMGPRKRLIDDDETSSQIDAQTSSSVLQPATPGRISTMANGVKSTATPSRKGKSEKRRRTSKEEMELYEFELEDGDPERVESTPVTTDRRAGRRR